MNDRELLELAAKAGGINGRYYEFAGEFGLINDDPDCGFWNPLTSDGDALRLAVKLEIAIFPPKNESGDFAVASLPNEVSGMQDTWIQESVMTRDKDAATRRAITRAAAEIGRTMK